jgi:hypothetical protein
MGVTIQCHQVVLVVELGSQYSFRIVWQNQTLNQPNEAWHVLLSSSS